MPEFGPDDLSHYVNKHTADKGENTSANAGKAEALNQTPASEARKILGDIPDIASFVSSIDRLPSARAEANNEREAEVRELIEPKELKEKYYAQMIEMIRNPDSPLRSMSTEEAIRELHRIATQGLNWNALREYGAPDPISLKMAEKAQGFASGVYRDMRIQSGPGTEFMNVRAVPNAMKELGSAVDRMVAQYSGEPDDLTPELIATWAYINLEAIHPFLDANGRVGEGMIELILAKAGKESFAINHELSRITGSREKLAVDPVEEILAQPTSATIDGIKNADIVKLMNDPVVLGLTIGFIETKPETSISS